MQAASCRLTVGKRAREEWDEGEGGPPPCPLEPQPVPMEDKACYPHLLRACPDGIDTRSSWTLEQLECLWAELDMLLAEVEDRRARLHGERASLAVWMALSLLKCPGLQPADDVAASGARTRSSAMAGGEAAGVERQLSVTLGNRGQRDRQGRFLKPEPDSPRCEPRGDAAAVAAPGASGCGAARAKGAELAEHEHEGEAAGYEIRRVSAEADPEALWQFTQAFFEPLRPEDAQVLDADARVRRFCGDEPESGADPFELGPRGRYYLLQWEEEGQLLGLASCAPSAAPTGAGAGWGRAGGGEAAQGGAGEAARELLHWEADAADGRRLTERVFSALVDRPGFVPRADAAPTRAGSVDSLSLSLPAARAAMSVVGEEDTRQRSAQMEAQLRVELLKVGLIDSADAQAADEDDSLCAELRLMQEQLRAAVCQNETLCRESRARFEVFLQAQHGEQRERARSDALLERWRGVMQRLKAERKAERRRKKAAGGARRAAGAAAPAAAREGSEGAAPERAGAEAAPGAAPETAGAPKEGEGGASNDESSEEEREEEPGPGWGAAAPDSIAGAAATSAPTPPRAATARKRATRAHPGPSPSSAAAAL